MSLFHAEHLPEREIFREHIHQRVRLREGRLVVEPAARKTVLIRKMVVDFDRDVIFR